MSHTQVEISFIGVSIVPGHETSSFSLAVKDLTFKLPMVPIIVNTLEAAKVNS